MKYQNLLLEQAAASILDQPASDRGSLPDGLLADELHALLVRRNGFFAYDMGLHVLPSAVSNRLGVQHWNAPATWRHHFDELAHGHWFFAQDVFGVQFSVFDDAIHTWDPETGEASPVANSVEEWCAHVVTDSDYLVGAGIAREWQEANRPIEPNERLRPKMPFVLGGKYEASFLYAIDAVKALDFAASIAHQIKGLPDGTPFEVRIEAPPAE